MHLLIDLGNTALKWRESGTRRGGGIVHDRRWDELAAALRAATGDAVVVGISIASVAGAEAEGAVGEALQRAFGVVPRFFHSASATLGVRNAYAEPERLGVDRWLGVIEAWHRFGASIVVDAGSAVTVDAVAADGHHLGGYIVPGLSLLRASLGSGTGSVRVEESGTPSTLPGVSTGECVNHGTLLMTCAFVREAVVASRRGLPDTSPIVVAGGDAPLLLPLLGLAVEHVPDLVLDGLERVAGCYIRGE